MANGTGHHQCSQKTLRLPWLLSRPVQKTPSKMNKTPTAAPMRLAIELTTTGYLRRAVAAPDIGLFADPRNGRVDLPGQVA
jgi:hypothetical protein